MKKENNIQPARDIWAELMAQPRPHRVVDFPRHDKDGQPYCQVAMVILTAEESAAVTASAEKKTRQVLKEAIPGKTEVSKGYDELFRDFSAEGILFRSCKNVNDLTKPFFPDISAIFNVLTVDEVGILLNHYYDVAINLGPVIGELSEAEMESWMKKIVEGGTQSRFLLNSFSSVALKELILYLANRLENLQTAK